MYKVAIVGCGSIGALKPDDIDYPGGPNIFTHAHAFAANPRTKLMWMIDPDGERAKQAADKWGGMPFTDMRVGFEYLINERPDIVVVAAPTHQHATVLAQVLLYKPRLVIAEKPFCDSLWKARMIDTVYREAGVPIMVNYTRRFVPQIRQLKMILDEETIRWCAVKYTRGFVREASHALDLCGMLFGNFTTGQIAKREVHLVDYGPDDPTYGAVLQFDRCPFVYFCPSSGANYNIFEVEICTSRTIVTLLDNGAVLMERKMKPSPYGNYKTIDWQEQTASHTDLHHGLTLLVQEAVRHLDSDGREPLSCTAREAVAVHEIYDKLFRRLEYDNE